MSAPGTSAGVARRAQAGAPRRICLVTAADSDEALRWNLEPARIAVPTVVYCTAEVAALFGDQAPMVRVVPMAAGGPPTPRDRLLRLAEAGADGWHDADAYYWIDLPLLYQHLSFEFAYSDLLLRALRHLGGGPLYLPMPGYPPSGFFGGPRAAVQALGAGPAVEPSALFETVVGGAGDPPPFRMAFGTCADDLNLQLGRLVAEPVVHVVGDSHVFSCFTPNRSIGCRQNVLVRTGEVSPLAVPYAYQFTHHLGGRTMHHAGAPDALVGIAEQCGVKDGDAVVWVFGEIDVRCHVLKRHREDGRALDEVIATLARRFMRGVRAVEARFPALRSVVFAPIPPLDNPDYTSRDLPVFGRIEERVDVTRRLRAALRAACARDGVGYVEAGPEFETERGDLRWELSDHFCHIGSANQGPIIERLYTVLG